MTRNILLFAAMMTLSFPAAAQEVAPALVIRAPDATGTGDPRKPLPLTKVSVEARVFGFLAETRMTMTFHNPHDRQLEGNLYFPLPEGSTVSGYALDINGQMVDGVVVEKDRARVVFEKEVRKGVDPGLVEWVKGNKFKTRIYPIPARGSRTVAVRYVSDLTFGPDGATYRLPLNFTEKIGEFGLRVEVGGLDKAPRANWSGPGKLSFARRRNGYFSETRVRDRALTGQLVVSLPGARKPGALVEKSPADEVHFCLSDFPVDPRKTPVSGKRPAPGRIRILWDASGSRGNSDHDQELRLLQSWFAGHKKSSIKVDLVLFRNQAAKPQTFVIRNGDAAKLLARLRAVEYDGGTQIGAIPPPPRGQKPDFTFLFSDGISNFGSDWPGNLQSPVYAFSAGAGTNHLFLRRLAHSTGGDYFNLDRGATEAALAGIGKPAYSFLKARIDSGKVDQLVPATGRPVSGRFTLAGKLLSDQATVTLQYGVGGKVMKSETFRISKKDAAKGDLLARTWAQKSVMELAMFPGRNQKKLVELGKRYGLVTPGTSLIVLERLEQYVEHEIEPPRSLPDMRNQYLRIMDERMAQKKKEDKDKLQAVLALWNKRVDWWKTRFKYPKNFRYRDPAKHKKSAARPSSISAGSDAPAEEAEMRMADEAPRPPPHASPAPMQEPHAPVAKKPAGGKDSAGSDPEPAIALKPWDPKTPYMQALKKAPGEKRYAEYLAQKKTYGQSPAFFLDNADYFLRQKQPALGLQILSNVAEMELENASLLRILAHRLAQIGLLDLAASLFEEVLRLRPEEPQSYRDLALVLAEQKKYPRAMELLAHVVMNKWDRFDEIEVIALMELNAMIPRARAAGVKKIPLDKRLIKLLPVDVRIVMSWDADLTDIDLWVIEPSGEKAYYSHPNTTIGGLVSRDFTQGYGPETYNNKKAMHGTYKVQVNFFGSQAQTLSGAVTLYLDLYTNYGRRNQKKKSVTLRLTEKKETITVGVLEF